MKILNSDKILINNFFYNILCFLTVYNSEETKWKVQGECFNYIKNLYKIAKEIKIHDNTFEEVILDLEGVVVSKGSNDDFLDKYKDFILKYNN